MHQNVAVIYVVPPITAKKVLLYLSQSVSLGSGCVYLGIVIHELMHAVGEISELVWNQFWT